MTQETLHTLTQTFFEKLGVSVSDIVVTVGHRTVVAVSSPDSDMLVGHEGEVLRAINTLLRHMVEKAHGHEAASFLVDVNQYHEAQVEKVRTAARMSAQRARLFKQDVALDPMTPYDRLVVHELFAEDAEIETRSEGEGATRHIVLHYRA